MLIQAKMRPARRFRRLRDEHRGDRQIQGAAVQIETITRRQHKPDNGFGYAKPLHDFHRFRQSRLAARRHESQNEGVFNGGDERL